MVKIFLDAQKCKGCGLCVRACPKHIIALAEKKLNAGGYHPAEIVDPAACIGCACCGFCIGCAVCCGCCGFCIGCAVCCCGGCCAIDFPQDEQNFGTAFGYSAPQLLHFVILYHLPSLYFFGIVQFPSNGSLSRPPSIAFISSPFLSVSTVKLPFVSIFT